uniref:Uncharacterized protein n=1 Tax=Astyanax mexicanus TaxID=7994 RepID=A0A8B9K545_ASTMX
MQLTTLGTKDKLNSLVIFDKTTYDKLRMRGKALFKRIVRSPRPVFHTALHKADVIYTRNTKSEHQAAAEKLKTTQQNLYNLKHKCIFLRVHIVKVSKYSIHSQFHMVHIWYGK